ncbi:MAG TPA: acyltransferase domain-containing protein, partial [Polyangiaceae bacterium]|nr:acyltransferase domain-containing protein [Polyangiaceae bacterium]
MAQPALFTLEYALSRLWASWGLTPEATLGHSVGEYVAACVGGCLSLEDALTLVAARGRLMEATAEGAMLAVAATESDARAWLGDELDLAAVNAPRQCVLSGPAAAIERLERDLTGRGVKVRRLPVTRAFHSRLMDGIIRDFTEEFARVKLRAPQTPWVSNLTGTWVTPAEAQDPGYWARHLRGAVRFADGVRTLWAKPERILLEVGPGQALSRLCRQVAGGGATGESEALAFGSLSAEDEAGASADADSTALLDAAARLWVAGAPLSFSGLRGGRRGRRVALPATPFEHKQRHWLDTADLGPHTAQARTGHAEARESSPDDVGEWFYAPSWRRAPLREREPAGEPSHWLVFADEGGIAPRLVERLEKAGHRVTLVRSGARFER